MAWDESKAWMRGRNNQKLYQALLDDASARRSFTPRTCPGSSRARGCSSIF